MADGQLVAEPDEIDFGIVAEGAGTSRTVTVGNPGADPITVSGIGVDATPGFSFGNNSCLLGTVLDQAETCTVDVFFSVPVGGTGSYDSRLTVSGGTGVLPAVTLLHGSARPRGQVTASPEWLDFMPTPVGGASRPRAVVVRNTGSIPVTLASTPVAGPFRVERSTCLRTLAPGAACQLAVVFAPVPDELDAFVGDPVRFGRIRLRTPDRLDLATVPLSGVVEPPHETARRIQSALNRLVLSVPRLVRGGPRGRLWLPSFHADVKGNLKMKLYTRRHGRLRLLARRSATVVAGEKRRLRFFLTKTGRRVLQQRRRPIRTVTLATFHAKATGTAVSASHVVVIRPRGR